MSDEHVHERHVTPVRFGTLQADIKLPSPEGDAFEHVLTGFCWCQPLVETTFDGSHLYIHRRSVDSPYIEPDRTFPSVINDGITLP